MNKKIIVFGMGYVGLSNALLLAQKNEVVGIEIVEEKVKLLNKKISPIKDKEISEFLETRNLSFIAKTNDKKFSKLADFAIIATPTNFDEEKNFFDTSSVDNVLENLSKLNSRATVVIKSTIPIGYTKKIKEKFKNLTILFSPEFLREGRALYDNLHPSRIIVGCSKSDKQEFEKAKEFANLLQEGTYEDHSPIFIMNLAEAESVKLFSNAYLAMRVAYFNEVDDYAIKNDLNTKDIVNGMCADPRIGNFYNNPSFGYGGYCFPKDTKQLKANYMEIPNSLIDSIVESNQVRKEFIANTLLEKTISSDTIGVYRLIMKSGSDNCRSSAIFDIIKILAKTRKVLIYEPCVNKPPFENCQLENDIEKFKKNADIVLANRVDEQIKDIKEKIYTRDIFGRD